MNSEKIGEPQSQIPPEDLDLLRQIIGYLETKLKIGLAVQGLSIQDLTALPEAQIYSALTNTEEGDHLFSRFKALPGERFALAMDALMLFIILRGVSAVHKQGPAVILFEELIKQPGK